MGEIGGKSIVKKKIVVVDDEKPIADIVQFFLQKEGFSIRCAYNGQDAMELIEEIRPDMILLDMMLPDYDGVELCCKLRKKLDIPIIILTASNSENDRKRAIELGASGFVFKPFYMQELVALVKGCLLSPSKAR